MIKQSLVVIGILLVIIFISGCAEQSTTGQATSQGTEQTSSYTQPKTKEGAEATAEKFARGWEQKDFSELYDLFIPELQRMKSKTDFVAIMNYIYKDNTFVIRLDKISMESDEIAYAYYTYIFSISAIETKMPAMELEYVKNAWKVNAFAGYFSMNLDEKMYFDKIGEITEKQTAILTDFNLNWKMYEIYTKYDFFDMTYCSNFEKNSIDTKNNYNNLISLNVPEGLHEYHNFVLSLSDDVNNSMLWAFRYCIAPTFEEKNTRYSLLIFYLNSTATKSNELVNLTQQLSEKYHIE